MIDTACDSKDEIVLQKIIDDLQEYVEGVNGSGEKVRIYYFLANAWSGLKEIRHTQDDNNILSLEQKEVFKVIYYLRKAILETSFDGLDIVLRLSIYTNLANAFSHYGRTINALKYYEKALDLYPSFFMALVNKALCLETYTNLDYDYNHQYLILRNAYFDYKKANIAIDNFLQTTAFDAIYYQNIKNVNESNIQKIEEYLTKKWLNKKFDLNDYKLGRYKSEKIYRKWVLENRLFLNSMNDLGSYSIAAHDPLNLPNLFTKKLNFPKYIPYFNQMKQEYITYRYLLFEGLNEFTKKFYDKDVSITDDYDYNLYDINIEKIKIAFKSFYSLFDKIAYFMNEYFELGLGEREVDFRKVWYLKGNKQQLNPMFDKSQNLALRGLYLISKDLYFNNQDEESQEFRKVIEPEAQEINNIRNHLEHKFITIKILDIRQFGQFSDRERPFYITQDELINKTIKLAQLTREAMIYLSFSVHIEEKKKQSNEEKYLEIPLLKNS